jgi:hypothetical protein
MKRYYSSEHNRLMLSPKMTEPEMKIGSKYDLGFTYDHEWFIRDLTAYSTWLSSGLTIIGEHNWKDLQEVVEGEDYETQRQFKSESIDGYKSIWLECVSPTNYYLHNNFELRIVAIPKKEKEDYVPNVQSNNEASVASHSSGFSNSIEQPASIEMANRILANYKPDNMYEHNEIKKLLYKQQPKAKFIRMKSNHAYYGTFVELADKTMQEVVFIIPFSDLGDAELWRDEDAKLLIRYLPKNN